MKIASAKFDNARISLKQSMILCRKIKGKKLESAKRLLQDLIDQKRDLEGKYYPTTAEKILEVLDNAEANAKQKNLNSDRLFVKKAKADQGEAFSRPRSKFRLRGQKVKSTTLNIEIEER